MGDGPPQHDHPGLGALQVEGDAQQPLLGRAEPDAVPGPAVPLDAVVHAHLGVDRPLAATPPAPWPCSRRRATGPPNSPARRDADRRERRSWRWWAVVVVRRGGAVVEAAVVAVVVRRSCVVAAPPPPPQAVSARPPARPGAIHRRFPVMTRTLAGRGADTTGRPDPLGAGHLLPRAAPASGDGRASGISTVKVAPCPARRRRRSPRPRGAGRCAGRW